MAARPMRLCACGCNQELTSRGANARYRPLCYVRVRLAQNRAAMERLRHGVTLVNGDISPDEIEQRFAQAMARIKYLRNVEPRS